MARLPVLCPLPVGFQIRTFSLVLPYSNVRAVAVPREFLLSLCALRYSICLLSGKAVYGPFELVLSSAEWGVDDSKSLLFPFPSYFASCLLV
jgi:hypothetical protein